MASRTTTYFAPWALLPDGWAEGVRLAVEDGAFAEVTAGASASRAEPLPGAVVPGMVDAHAHAFQRAVAAQTQRRSAGDATDSFWTWREAMYELAARLDADGFESATFARYADLLRGGYTSVIEFHYLHRDRDGAWYPDRDELAHRVVRAAQRAGIGLTLLPVFYAHGDAGGAPPDPRQHRFLSDVDGFLARWDALAARYGGTDVRLGVAPHSVRAATLEEIATIVREVHRRDATAPVHIHVSEQPAEVERSRAAYGATPIAALDARVGLDRRWSLVHATHATDDELARIARNGATVVLCPTTEADLGDGIAPAEALVRHGIPIAIGSDSGVAVDAADELRWLEYGQRLALRRRAVLATRAQPSVATWMWNACAAGGARASGRTVGAIRVGCRADLVVVGADAAALDEVVFLGRRDTLAPAMIGGNVPPGRPRATR